MELTSHKSVAVLSFSEGSGYPRISGAVLAELAGLLSEVRAPGLFRGVVIAASSRSFATGASVEEVASVTGAVARQFAQTGQTLFDEIEHFPLPVVAAIRGYCLGGGLDLALACRARVATYDASFGCPDVTLGLVTGWGGTQRLARLIGRAAASQLILTAERVPASQALTLGLVDELVPSQDLLDASALRAGGK
jgi:enoyl-CoA hydratase/carnithine racemase